MSDDKVIIVFQHPSKTLDEWETAAPAGWDLMNGAARREWAIRKLRKWNSTYKYQYFEWEE